MEKNGTTLTNTKNVYKEGNYYRGKKSYKGQVISVRGHTIAECKLAIELKMAKIDNGTLELNTKNHCKLTIYDLYFEYEKFMEPRWKANTKEGNRSIFRNHFRTMYDVSLAKITDEILCDWALRLNKMNTGRNTFDMSNIPAKCSRLMRRMLELAIRKQHIKKPLDFRFMMMIKGKSKNYVSERTQNNYLTFKELDIITKAVPEMPELRQGATKEDMLFIMRFLYFTGLRISEARAITKGDIKKKYSRMGKKTFYVVMVDKQYDEESKTIISNLKCNTPSREIYVYKETYEEFMAYFKKKGYDDDRLVLDVEDRGEALHRKTLTKKIKRFLCKMQELELIPEYFNTDITPQGFRRSNTVYHKNVMKLDVIEAARMEGHSPAVMQNIYDRIDREELMNKLGSED